jgi:hypothetical protein
MLKKNLLPHLLSALWPFLTSRSLIFLILILTPQLNLNPTPARNGIIYSPFLDLNFSNILSSLSRIFTSADAWWYLDIAKNGYTVALYDSQTPRNWVFFPLYPLLLRGLDAFFANLTLASVITNNLLFFLSLLLFSLYLEKLELDKKTSNRVLWFMSFFPASYFFSAPLTESLFLFLLVLSFLFLELKKFNYATFAVILCSLTRPTGILILPGFIAKMLTSNLPRKTKFIHCLILPIGLSGFMYHLNTVCNNPFAWIQNQSAWGRNKQGVFGLFSDLLSFNIDFIYPWNFIALNTASAIFALLCSLFLFYKKRWHLALVVLIPILSCLNSGTVQSIFRFTNTLFPIFIVIGEITKIENIEKTILLIFATLLCLMTLGYSLQITAAMA